MILLPMLFSIPFWLTRESEPNPQPSVLGVLRAGDNTIAPSRGLDTSDAPGLRGVIARDPSLNDLNVTQIIRINDRLQSSLYPGRYEVTLNFSVRGDHPKTVRGAFFPGLSTRHVDVADVHSLPHDRAIAVTFRVDTIGADMIWAALMSQGGVRGLVFLEDKRALDVFAHACPKGSPLATVSLHAQPPAQQIEFRSEVEFPVWIRSIKIALSDSIVTVYVDRFCEPWKSMTIDLCTVERVTAKNLTIDYELFYPDPGAIRTSNSQPVIKDGSWGHRWVNKYWEQTAPATRAITYLPVPCARPTRCFGKGHCTCTLVPVCSSVTPPRRLAPVGPAKPTDFVSAHGIMHYRFESAGASSVMTFPAHEVTVGLKEGEYAPLMFMAGPSLGSGYVHRATNDVVRAYLTFSRLTFRAWQRENLFVLTPDNTPIVLRSPASYFDADSGYLQSALADAKTVRNTIILASELADQEIHLIASDEKLLRLHPLNLTPYRSRLLDYATAATEE
jgi:hypothetical protein